MSSNATSSPERNSDCEVGRVMKIRNQIAWMLCGACLLGVGVLLGSHFKGELNGSAQAAIDDFNETLLHASTASTGDHFSLATGLIDQDAEGVFVLDYVTGILKCAVLNHRTGKFAALFTTNVTKDLGASKNAKYQMVTGLVNFNRGSSFIRPGMSVVYVLDSNSGKMAAYGIPWQRDAAQTGRPQLGMLKTIDGMQVRTIQLRNQ